SCRRTISRRCQPEVEWTAEWTSDVANRVRCVSRPEQEALRKQGFFLEKAGGNYELRSAEISHRWFQLSGVQCVCQHDMESKLSGWLQRRAQQHWSQFSAMRSLQSPITLVGRHQNYDFASHGERPATAYGYAGRCARRL